METAISDFVLVSNQPYNAYQFVIAQLLIYYSDCLGSCGAATGCQ